MKRLLPALLLAACSPALPGPAPLPTPAIDHFSALRPGEHAKPYDLAVDGAGNIWAMYAGSNKVAKLAPDGTLVDVFQLGGEHTVIASDPQGHIWLGGPDGTLASYDAGAQLLASFQVGSGQVDLAMDGDGNAWVANFAAKTVTSYNPQGKKLHEATLPENPTRIAANGHDGAWVATRTDQGAKNLWKLAPEAKIAGSYSLQGQTYALLGDAGSGLWRADDQGLVTRLEADGTTGAQASIGGVIYGMAASDRGDIWITSAGRPGGVGQVAQLIPKGIVQRTFDVGTSPGSVVVDKAGRAWVLDRLDGSVTRVTLPPPAPPSISPEAFAQLSFQVTPASNQLVAHVGRPLKLAVTFNYHQAPATWRVAEPDRATIDPDGTLHPLRTGPVHVLTKVENQEVTSLVAVVDDAVAAVHAARLPDGASGSAPSSGATLITSAEAWQAIATGYFKPLPPPTPVPTLPIDFTKSSVLITAFDAPFGRGSAVVTSLSPRIEVTYPKAGAYMVPQIEGAVVNALAAFELPAVSAGTEVVITDPNSTFVARPITW